jgi:tRNA modification GTPase
VGKSTLMNLLAGCERSIVTELAGTTRDVVEETVRLGEVTLRLADTAGIHDTTDRVEAIGVARAKDKLAQAALVLCVFDAARPLGADDLLLLEALDPERTVAVINKTDLPAAWDEAVLARIPTRVPLSAQSGEGLSQLAAAVETVTGVAHLDGNAPMLATERQFDCVWRCREALREARAALDMGWTLDAVNVSLDSGLGALLELSGERTTEAVVNEVFARFCVGK